MGKAKPKRLTVDELLRLACLYAEQHQLDYAVAIAGTGDDWDETKAETEQFIKQVRAYRLKRWGKTKLEGAMDNMKPVTVAELMARDTNKPGA